MAIAEANKGRPFVFMGDFNVDPSYPAAKCGDCMGQLVASGWQHALPSSGASYWTVAGGLGKKLDLPF